MSNDDNLAAGDAATDPGALSDVADATSDDDAETALNSSRPAYSDEPDGKDPQQSDAPGAGRGSVSDVGGG